MIEKKEKENLLNYENSYLFEKLRRRKNQKTFSISGCNDVKNSSHLYTYCVLLILIIIIIIIMIISREKKIVFS